MPVNLNLDDELTELESVGNTAVGFSTKLIQLLRALVKSADNPFGTAAVRNVGTHPGAVVQLDEQGKVPAALLPGSDNGGGGGFAGGFAPGDLKLTAVATAPAGWLLCQGQSISRSTYADLYGAIGTRFGGSGSSFKVPDLRRRVPVGSGGTGTSILRSTLGSIGGSERHTLTVNEIANHTHIYWRSDPDGARKGAQRRAVSAPWTNYWAEVAQVTRPGRSAGGGGSHNNIQPSMVLNYLIKT